MNVQQLFLQRYTVLYDFWLAGFWEAVADDLMRQRPHPRVNSLAWNLWHLTRVEDAAMNRFIVDLPQVFDTGEWMQRLNVPWRHNGSEMTFAEVENSISASICRRSTITPAPSIAKRAPSSSGITTQNVAGKYPCRCPERSQIAHAGKARLR